MKINAEQTEPTFKPVTITIVLESLEEVQAMEDLCDARMHIVDNNIAAIHEETVSGILKHINYNIGQLKIKSGE